MKKMLILCFLMLILSSCRAANTIYYNIYIASIGFEKSEEGYTGYFFLPSSMDVGNTKKESTDVSSQLAVVQGKNIPDVLNSLELSSSLELNLKHISSFVLHESILNQKDIEDLISYVKESPTFDFNIYIFTTKDSVKDIYSIKNPNNESIILTMLCEPVTSAYTFMAAKPPHFLNFCRDYYNGKVLPLALLEPGQIWKEEIDSTYCRGVTFFNGDKAYGFKHEEADFSYLKSNKTIEYNDESISVCLSDYSCKVKYKEKVEIQIQSKYSVLYSHRQDIKRYLEEQIESKIKDLLRYQEEIDFLNLAYYDSLDKPIEIKILLKESK